MTVFVTGTFGCEPPRMIMSVGARSEGELMSGFGAFLVRLDDLFVNFGLICLPPVVVMFTGAKKLREH